MFLSISPIYSLNNPLRTVKVNKQTFGWADLHLWRDLPAAITQVVNFREKLHLLIKKKEHNYNVGVK